MRDESEADYARVDQVGRIQQLSGEAGPDRSLRRMLADQAEADQVAEVHPHAMPALTRDTLLLTPDETDRLLEHLARNPGGVETEGVRRKLIAAREVRPWRVVETDPGALAQGDEIEVPVVLPEDQGDQLGRRAWRTVVRVERGAYSAFVTVRSVENPGAGSDRVRIPDGEKVKRRRLDVANRMIAPGSLSSRPAAVPEGPGTS